MKISIGADHRGYELKQFLVNNFSENDWVDCGCDSEERSDFPTFAKRVCDCLINCDSERGVLICGSGIGMAVAANRFCGIYAALCWNVEVAMIAREHNGANVLVLPADFVSQDEASEIFKTWLGTGFLGGLYQLRLEMIE